MNSENFKRSMYVVVLPWIDKALDGPPTAVARICTWEEMANVAGVVDDERALLDVLIDWSEGDFPGDDCESASDRPLTDAGYMVGFWTMELEGADPRMKAPSSSATLASSTQERGPSAIPTLD